MTLRRQEIVGFVVIAAVVWVFLSPLVPLPAGLVGRHHSSTSLAVTFSLALLPIAATACSLTLPSADTNPIRSESLLELNCVRLC